jgi:hypothetical protein
MKEAKYSLYTTSGEITKVYHGSNPEMQGEDFFVEGDSDDSLQYIPDIANPIITDKPANPAMVDKVLVDADGVDSVCVTNVPIDSVVALRGGGIPASALGEPDTALTGVATTSDVELIFDAAGAYTLTIELFPFLPFTVDIDAS